jgi:signal-transduction protein with cAMP-binding, CBS, and nucleotidyltransferase domain
MLCPFCGADNIPGIDLCEACGSDLAGLDTVELQGRFQGRLMSDRIGDLTMGPALLVDVDTSVGKAVETMRRFRHGCVLVQDGDRLVGIFTERDLLTRVILKGLDPAEVLMGTVMTRAPFTLAPGDPPAFAIHRMVAQGLRHLPVIDSGELQGFVSARNILRYIHEEVIGD